MCVQRAGGGLSFVDQALSGDEKERQRKANAYKHDPRFGLCEKCGGPLAQKQKGAGLCPEHYAERFIEEMTGWQ